MSVTDSAVGTDSRMPTGRNAAIPGTRAWTSAYLRRVALADLACALAAGAVAARVRFGGEAYLPLTYLGLTCGLPIAWWMSVLLAGGYNPRFIGFGSDEFRRILNAAVYLTAGVALISYVAKLDLARGYVTIALPCLAVMDLTVRYLLRKRLHRQRVRGWCVRRGRTSGQSRNSHETVECVFPWLSMAGVRVALTLAGAGGLRPPRRGYHRIPGAFHLAGGK